MTQEIKQSQPLDVVFENIRHPEIFTRVASEIQDHVKKNKLVMAFKGKDGQMNAYPLVEAWQFCGALLGLFPRLVEARDLSREGVLKFHATVEIVEQSTGKVISRGEAICSNLEPGKQYFQEYAVFSMAQTRAVGKAFRLCLGWIMKAAGFEPAPAEEVDGYDGDAPAVTDARLMGDYKNIAMQAIAFAAKAAHVEKLVNMAKPHLGKDAAFLDTARAAWAKLAEFEKQAK